MEQASAALEFEQAARYRDQITRLRRCWKSNLFMVEGGDMDIIACATAS